MTFCTYIDTVPATNNNPSEDQPDMLTNTQSTSTIIAVDHVGFNLNNGGEHKQITFNQDASYVPIVPTNPPVLFTDIINGIPQIKFFSGNASHSSSQYANSGSAGSTFALGGVIIKWGTAAIASSGLSTVNFNTAFNNNCYAVVVTSTTATSNTFYVTNFTTASFQCRASSSASNINYIAIGN